MRVAVGQIQAGDAHSADIGFKIARLFAFAVFGAINPQTALHFGDCVSGLRIHQNRHAVEGFLPVPDRCVTQRLDLGGGDAFVL